MLEQLFEFLINHWLLSSIWLGLFVLLVLTESARGGKALSPAQVTQLINKEDAKVVDIRARDEFNKGHLPNAINIPARDLEKRASELSAFKDKPVILICKSGTTAGASGALLAKQGFTKLSKLRGGITEWQGSNLPLVKG